MAYASAPLYALASAAPDKKIPNRRPMRRRGQKKLKYNGIPGPNMVSVRPRKNRHAIRPLQLVQTACKVLMVPHANTTKETH